VVESRLRENRKEHAGGSQGNTDGLFDKNESAAKAKLVPRSTPPVSSAAAAVNTKKAREKHVLVRDKEIGRLLPHSSHVPCCS
jgi:hypothetical protein